MLPHDEPQARPPQPSAPFRARASSIDHVLSDPHKAKRLSLRAQPCLDGLENRQLLTASVPDIQMTAATTRDSQSVTIDYTVLNGPITQPVTVGIYRSAEPQFGSDAVPVASLTIEPADSSSPTTDEAGASATSPGTHEVTLTIPGGLPLNPEHPYVIVEVDPDHALAGTDPTIHTAEFQTHTIAVITHGGIQPSAWKKGPPWELLMAADLRKQGYDTVIPYNWVAQSTHAGAAVKQVPRLAEAVAHAASQFPASDPVDVHFIGHSEGTVINSLAIVRLKTEEPAQMKAGWLEETMLDPHSANNNFPGPQYSVSGGMLGAIAKSQIKSFQAKANDPLPFVPGVVDQAQVFFQHTAVAKSDTHFAWPGTIPRTSLSSLDNLWGQVPVSGNASYFDITGDGVSHSGHFGIQDWYRLNVVPTLGNGAPLIQTNILTIHPGQSTPASFLGSNRFSQVTYTGTSAPDAAVRVFARTAHSHGLVNVGQATADSQGAWTVTTRPLAPGRYRVVSVANVPSTSARRPIHMRPTAWAPTLTIAPRAQR